MGSAVPEGKGLSKDHFLKLLRDNAISEGAVLAKFMDISADGRAIPAEECRSCLLLFANEALAVDLNDVRWENAVDVAMRNCDMVITIEAWSQCCQRLCRMIRLARFLKA